MSVLDLEIWENGDIFTSDQFGDDTMNNRSAKIIELKKKIEASVERVMHTPADFDYLSGAIWDRIQEYISPHISTIVRNQDIRRFEIPMYHSLPMEIRHRIEYLIHSPAAGLFRCCQKPVIKPSSLYIFLNNAIT